MKKSFAILFGLFLALLLGACGNAGKDRSIQVFIEETEGVTLSEQSLRILPGEDAVFSLRLKKGTMLLSADYSGEYEISEAGEETVLTLKAVRFPTRVRLALSAKSGRIRYEGNGGLTQTGETSEIRSYSLVNHKRANTSTGTDTFQNPGHTLLCWNTAPDGSGERVGLGSRVTLPGAELTLYGIWAPWTRADAFTWKEEVGKAVITGYTGDAENLVIPGELGSLPVSGIAAGAFTEGTFTSVVLPATLETLEKGAFTGCAFTELTMFDNLADFSDESFLSCDAFTTLHINAAEAPFGYVFRKESVYADKMDLLILNQGRKKMIFYGGCSMWYNLDGLRADKMFGSEYIVMDLALNGTVSSAVQMQIMAPYLEEGDIFFHTPELSSRSQLMLITGMRDDDSSLWCGIENNYDLFSLVDLRTVEGVFDSFCRYLSLKDKKTDYMNFYSDDFRVPYVDRFGCIPFFRSEHSKNLADRVSIKPEVTDGESLETLRSYYERYAENGVRIYVSYACVNVDALPEEDLEMLDFADQYFRRAIEEMGVATPVSHLSDYLFSGEEYYDTNYHLLSEPAMRNTDNWLRDLKAQMITDGLWGAEE